MINADSERSQYSKEIESWRQQMNDQMCSPEPWGWLAIVGMYPLKEGRNTIGSAQDSDILLPANQAPETLGYIDFQTPHGELFVTTNEKVSVDKLELKQVKLRNHYEAGGMSVVQVRDISFGIMQWASDPYNIRVWDANSPKRMNFKGRNWFPIDEKYRVQGKFNSFDSHLKTTVNHTGGETQELISIGTVDFKLFGQSFHFEAMASELGKDFLWLLMRDETSGKSTYGAGRFMMAALASDGTVDIDFNTFYQPPCAFSDYTTCPMPPLNNRLPFAIEAGERFPE